MKKITWKQLLKALAWIVVYWENIRKVLIAAVAVAAVAAVALLAYVGWMMYDLLLY